MKTVTPAARRLIPVPLIVWSDLRSIDAIAWSTEIRQAETDRKKDHFVWTDAAAGFSDSRLPGYKKSALL